MFIGPGRELYDDVQELQEQLMFPTPSWPPALAEYSSERLSSQFQELWMMSDVYILASAGWDCNLAAFDGKLIFEGSFDQNELTVLNRLDLETGEIVWQLPLDREGPDHMVHNSNTIFYSSGIPGNIVAYDVESGRQIWEHTLSWREKNIIYYMQATDGSLYVNSTTFNFNVFDTYAGRPQEWESSIDAYPIFYVDNDVIYHRTTDTRVLATDRITESTVWAVTFDEPIRISPIFTEELVVAKTGELGTGQVYSIDRKTGTILWQRPPGTIDWENPKNLQGNVATDGEHIFYLTVDSQLQAANAKTGQMLGYVQFAPSLQELEGSDQVNSEFCVASSDNIVVLYLGSGRQLFAFRFLPDN